MIIHMGYTYFHGFCPLREVYPHNSSPNFLVISFPIMFLLSAYPSSQAHGHSPWISMSGHFFQAKWTTKSTAQSSAHWEEFPSPLPFRDGPERGCSAVAVHFRVVSAYSTETPINQAWDCSSSVNWEQGTPHEARSAVGERRQCRRRGTTNISATSLCNLLVPSGCAWDCSHTYRFHLRMECCCAHPTWLGASIPPWKWLCSYS